MGAIVARAPLRVALGGGGTDLPSYYREHGGFVVSTAIDRHVHIVATAGFQARYILKHLEWEEVDDPAEVRHPILREALAHHWNGGPVELVDADGVSAVLDDHSAAAVARREQARVWVDLGLVVPDSARPASRYLADTRSW